MDFIRGGDGVLRCEKCHNGHPDRKVYILNKQGGYTKRFRMVKADPCSVVGCHCYCKQLAPRKKPPTDPPPVQTDLRQYREITILGNS